MYNTKFEVVSSEDVQVLWLLLHCFVIHCTVLCGSGSLDRAWFSLYDLRQILWTRALGYGRRS